MTLLHGRQTRWAVVAIRGRTPRRSPASDSEGERGQATVEFALTLPLLMLFLLAIVQLVVVVRDQLSVVHAAREGARAAAVSASPSGDGSAAAQAATPLDVSIGVTTSGDRVIVTVRHTTRTDVPLIGALLPDISLIGEGSMKLEP